MRCHVVESQSDSATWRWIDYREKVCRSPYIHASECSGVVDLTASCTANHNLKAKRCVLLFLWTCDWRKGLVCALDREHCPGVGLPTLAHLRSRFGIVWWLLGAYRSYLVYRLELMREMSLDSREEREDCENSRSSWFAGPMGICWWGENPSQRFQMGQST